MTHQILQRFRIHPRTGHIAAVGMPANVRCNVWHLNPVNIIVAYEEGQAKLKGNGKSVPALSVLKTPLRDGDAERPDDEVYRNSYFINANSATAPGIVDADRNQIIDRSEMYSGVKGRASINLYAFNSNGNKGIACGLNNLQKIADGTPLGGKSRAEDDFATADDEDFLN